MLLWWLAWFASFRMFQMWLVWMSLFSVVLRACWCFLTCCWREKSGRDDPGTKLNRWKFHSSAPHVTPEAMKLGWLIKVSPPDWDNLLVLEWYSPQWCQWSTALGSSGVDFYVRFPGMPCINNAVCITIAPVISLLGGILCLDRVTLWVCPKVFSLLQYIAESDFLAIGSCLLFLHPKFFQFLERLWLSNLGPQKVDGIFDPCVLSHIRTGTLTIQAQSHWFGEPWWNKHRSPQQLKEQLLERHQNNHDLHAL